MHTGSEISSQLLANYAEIKKRHASVTKKVIKLVITFIGLTFLPTAVFPVSYVFFHYPQPDQWNVPVDYQ